MHPFQENLQTWLSRKLASSEQNHCYEVPLVLATDIGLVRTENQDRAAALYTGKKSINPLFVIAVADGMGGMRDGGICANLALSSFFHAIIQYRNLDIRARATEAIKEANNQVFDKYRGGGGSTLTAVLFDSLGTKIIVHLGDTRIYTFGPNKKVERHTTDDSLAEAVGGIGRELLQFVGMGESMQPKISEITHQAGFCAITTDGIHGIEERTLNKILANSESIEQASDRLSAVSKWCGGIDNSTSAIFDISEISSSITEYESSGIRVWDSGGDLTTLWLREEDHAFNIKQARNIEAEELRRKPKHDSQLLEESAAKPVKKSRSNTGRSKSKKQDGNYQEKIQLDIEIGNSD
ncbi:PP2C family protein-serine/threonine phosphatase [Pseudomonas sp. JV245A]|uniref:PP2C family protein-serine/threonine phosphatase n=1 Tax=Pseudomonas sp. JV245A TaxID=1890668 RepID=UPI0028E11C18|nr:protein phosphatase 2C domain-containing protein [Pseudomonas sp. JV245A]MDT9646353.1 serine/threonine-protein phosphatase [Pseudomonas sp. JV245A]